MKRITFITAITAAACLLLAACSGTTQSSLGSEATNAISDVQTTVSQLSDQIANSDLPQDLTSAWDDQKAEINQAIDHITAGEPVDTAQLRQSMQDFQTALAASDAQQTMKDAWTNLQNDVESLLNQVQSTG